MPRKRAAFVNFTTIGAASKAKEAMHCKPLPGAAGADGGAPDSRIKPLLINFTSAQQNCMRARNGGRAAPSAGYGGEMMGHGGGGRGGRGERGGYGGHYGDGHSRGGGYGGERSTRSRHGSRPHREAE